MWDVLLLVLLADWFTAWLARRSGYPSLAANGPLLGALLGLSIGLITFFLSEPGVTFDTSGERYLDYTFFLLIHVIFAVVVVGFSFLAMALGTQLGLRLRLPARLRVLLGLGLALIVLALYALFMIRQFV